MVSSVPPLHPAAPKPPLAHFLRPRQSSSHNPKCLCCAHSCVTNRNRNRLVKTGLAASPSPSITPADPRSSLKFKIRLKKKGDNADECQDQSKSSEIRISKPTCTSTNAAAKDCLKIRLKKKVDNAAEGPDQSKSSDIRIIKPTCSSANAAAKDCLKIRLKKKGGNAAECPDQSKPSEIRITKPTCSSANAAAKDCSNSIPAKIKISKPSSSADAQAKDCRNTTPATELLRTSENRKRKSAGAEERPEFLLSLSKKEIEVDFLAMTGAKPPRRPTKRPKHIQEQLNTIFPGTYLGKRVTEAQYKVCRSDLQ